MDQHVIDFLEALRQTLLSQCLNEVGPSNRAPIFNGLGPARAVFDRLGPVGILLEVNVLKAWRARSEARVPRAPPPPITHQARPATTGAKERSDTDSRTEATQK